jgi:hypothetical protein
MSIKDLISAVVNKDAAAFESTFADVMQAKVSAALEARFAPVEEELDLEESKDEDEDEEDDDSDEEDEDEDDEDEEDMKEEVEELDELSDDKLRDYHAKAGADRMKAKAQAEKGMAAKKFTPASVQKTSDAYKRFVKRGKGMTAAANKMSE